MKVCKLYSSSVSISNYRKLEMIENLLCKKNVQDSTLLLSVSCL